MDNRDQLIVAQVAYKAAVDLAVLKQNTNEIDIDAQEIYDGIFQLAGHKTQPAAAKPQPAPKPARELVEEAFPDAEDVTDEDDTDVSDEPPYSPDTRVPTERKANKAWALATLKHDLANKSFFKAWYDNRESAAGTNRPVLKHKATTLGLWDGDIEGLNIPVSKFNK